MITLDFLLTKKCDQKCYYCNVYDKSIFVDEPYVDIDFLRYVLNNISFSFNVILGGGEPGIIVNIDDVYNELKKCNNVNNIRLLSNSKCRLNKISWLNEVDYYEHSITDIIGKNITTFNCTNILETIEIFKTQKNWKQVIVSTENVVTSLLNNYDYFEKIGMFSESFWYKLMNDKTHSMIKYKDKIIEFYTKINKTNELYCFENDAINKRVLCAKYPYMLSVDFEQKKILHCNANSIICNNVEFSKHNLENALIGKTFKQENYCTRCNVFNNDIVNTVIERSKFGKR